VDTILGPISFDSTGDVTPRRVTVYTPDAAGRWSYADQLEVAP
jgi:hypothetical protein